MISFNPFVTRFFGPQAVCLAFLFFSSRPRPFTTRTQPTWLHLRHQINIKNGFHFLHTLRNAARSEKCEFISFLGNSTLLFHASCHEKERKKDGNVVPKKENKPQQWKHVRQSPSPCYARGLCVQGFRVRGNSNSSHFPTSALDTLPCFPSCRKFRIDKHSKRRSALYQFSRSQKNVSALRFIHESLDDV